MTALKNLKPQAIWKYFDEILKIPRPSGKEERILEYLKAFASSNELTVKQDKTGNLLISKPAARGYETKKGVILQSHVDMVCEKNQDTEHNFETDPIEAYAEGGWVKAKGTTLGADNGIGIAAQLAVLADRSLKHGTLECLFTVDEERGLTGAFGLETGFLKGSVLLNLDSEDDGELFIGCAGGIDTLVDIPLITEKAEKNMKAGRIEVSGLLGGHSGDDINRGRGNANKIIARVLFALLEEFPVRLSSLEGGNLRNAIPREAGAEIVYHPEHGEQIGRMVEKYSLILKDELRYDAGVEINFAQGDHFPEMLITTACTQRIVNALHACVNGVVSMSQDIPELVETSTNLASIRTDLNNGVMHLITSQRSSVATAKLDLASRIRSLFLMCDAKVRHSDAYPGWNPNPDSQVLEVTHRAYTKLFGEEPVVRAIHAGLECGLFLEKYPEMDMVSFGPTIKGAHSPDERMEIHTVEKFWELLLEVLEQL